jgi:hypothetical protein
LWCIILCGVSDELDQGSANLAGSGTFTLNVTSSLSGKNPNVPIAQADSFATTFTKPVIDSVEDKPSCKKYTGDFSITQNGSKRDLSVILTQQKCAKSKNKKWIIGVSVVAGVVLVFVVTGTVLFLLHRNGYIGKGTSQNPHGHIDDWRMSNLKKNKSSVLYYTAELFICFFLFLVFGCLQVSKSTNKTTEEER